jgi:hypothetical protein
MNACGVANFRSPMWPKALSKEASMAQELSAWIREHTEGRVEVPEITSDSLTDILSTIPDYNPSQKQLIFLRNIQLNFGQRGCFGKAREQELECLPW